MSRSRLFWPLVAEAGAAPKKIPVAGAGAAREKNQEPEPLKKKFRSRSRPWRRSIANTKLYNSCNCGDKEEFQGYIFLHKSLFFIIIKTKRNYEGKKGETKRKKRGKNLKKIYTGTPDVFSWRNSCIYLTVDLVPCTCV